MSLFLQKVGKEGSLLLLGLLLATLSLGLFAARPALGPGIIIIMEDPPTLAEDDSHSLFYPNPVNEGENVNLYLPNLADVSQIRILKGEQEVYNSTGSFSDAQQLAPSPFDAGLYQCLITRGSNVEDIQLSIQ